MINEVLTSHLDTLSWTLTYHKETAGYLWSHEETKLFLGLWSSASVQKELEVAKRNKTAFLRIAKEMNEVGYERTWQQCPVKAKNIVSNYIKITKSSKMHAKRIELFLLLYALRCFNRKLLYIYLCSSTQHVGGRIAIPWSCECHAIEGVAECLRVRSSLVVWTHNRIRIRIRMRIRRIQIGMRI